MLSEWQCTSVCVLRERQLLPLSVTSYLSLSWLGGGGGGPDQSGHMPSKMTTRDLVVFLNGVDSILLCQSLLREWEIEWAGAGLKSHAVGPQLGSVTDCELPKKAEETEKEELETTTTTTSSVLKPTT